MGYPNNFPVNDECTSYTIEGDTLKKWLAKYKLAENTSVEDTIAYFVKRYGIISENIKEARKIISIRYEMSTKGYSSTKPLSLAENVSRNVVAQISERNSDFPGVTITTQSSRKYNYGSLASHILGYIGKISEKEYNEEQDVYENDDYVGRTGIESLFENTGIHFRASEYIQEEIWSKFRLNICNNLPQAILGAGVGCYRDSEHMKFIQDGLRHELETIAHAKGIDLSKADSSSSRGSAVPASARYSTLQDLDAKRHSEIDMFSGALIKMGKELHIPTPYNEYTYHMIKALEEKNDGLFDYDQENQRNMCSK